MQHCLATQHNWEGNQRCKSKLSFLVPWYTLVVYQTSLLQNTTLHIEMTTKMLHVAPEHAVVAPWTCRSCYYTSGILSLHSPATSPCTVPASLIYVVFTLLWGTKCELCTAFWGCMDRCGLPRPHSKLGESKPVQIWKSCICTDLTTWVQPWATPATQIPEVGGIQLAWKVSEANVCLSAPVLVNTYESTASLLGK